MTKISDDYVPNEKEKYMSDKQLQYFKSKLLESKEKILSEFSKIHDNLSDTAVHEADILDVATQESDCTFSIGSIKTKELQDIDVALLSITNKEYGYCIISEEKIGLNRLLVNPTTRYSIEAQEAMEIQNKTRKVDGNFHREGY